MTWLHRLERALASRLEGAEPPLHPLEFATALTDLWFQAPRAGKFRPNRFRIALAPGTDLCEAGVLGPLRQVGDERGWMLAGPLHLQVVRGTAHPELRFASSPEAADAVALVEGTGGLAAGKAVLVPPDGLVIGRSPEAGMRLGDPTVSRRHLTLTWKDGGLWAQAFSSRPGTSLNGKPLIEPARLKDRARLELGGSQLRIWLLGR